MFGASYPPQSSSRHPRESRELRKLTVEWTSSWYDALAYRGAAPGEQRERVLHGGSWADCAEACARSSADCQETATMGLSA